MNNKSFRKNGSVVFLFSLCLLLVTSGCEEQRKDMVELAFNPDSVPMITAHNVSELISDSGIVRYKLKADTWLFFERAKEPRWYFPKGIYVEQYDTALHVQSTIKSDTAWRFTAKSLWKLKGHVFVTNVRSETFSSAELYWDEKQKKIYTDSSIVIVRPLFGVTRGQRFESNESFTAWRIPHPDNSDVYVNDEE